MHSIKWSLVFGRNRKDHINLSKPKQIKGAMRKMIDEFYSQVVVGCVAGPTYQLKATLNILQIAPFEVCYRTKNLKIPQKI